MKDLAVIMSVYKNDKLSFVKLAVESILEQSYSNFNFYIQADGKLSEELYHYFENIKDQRLIFRRRDENKGLAFSLNELLSVVLKKQYNFIARMDADDISLHNRLEKQINEYKKFAHKVTVVADEKFIDKLNNLDFMNGVGIISVNSRNSLTLIRNSTKFEIGKNFYLAYWSPIELRESLRGFDKWYQYSSDEAYNKILEILNEDELRKVTLFRLKEKYIREHLKRKELIIEEKNYEKALLSRFHDLEQLSITPLKYLPAYIFRDFN